MRRVITNIANTLFCCYFILDPLLNYLSTAILKSWLQLVKKSSQDTLYIAHFF